MLMLTTLAPSATSATTPTTVSPAALTALSTGCDLSGATGSSATNQYPVTAIPNDAIDDTASIQGRINAAGSAGGGIVKLPAGTFIINGKLRMASNVKLEGVGPATILKAGPSFMTNTGPAGGYRL
ncbi:glycosyl hydrolase family 28-related protein [Paenarthrobacter sp. NPDC058233]